MKNNLFLDKNKCHLCGNRLFLKPIMELKGMPKAAQYYPEKNEFKKDNGITLAIRQCSFCGLVQHRMPPVDYYREVITAATLSEKSRLSRLSQMKTFAEEFGLTGKNILDIGTGKGEMIDVLNEAGFKSIGLEASKESVLIGRAAGRKILNGYIGQSKKISGGPYDAFISLNYLEHLPNIGAVIRNIHGNVADGAMGFITVPNFDYLLKTKAFYEFVTDHISYFTIKTLMYAFEINGFDVLKAWTINNENDIAAFVRKKSVLDLSVQYSKVDALLKDFQKLTDYYRINGKKIAIWGAGHRTLAFLALSKVIDIAYVIDSARFKQGKFTPVTHFNIVSPSHLKEEKVDLVIIMVPGLYPSEVLKTLEQMNTGVEVAMLRDDRIEKIK